MLRRKESGQEPFLVSPCPTPALAYLLLGRGVFCQGWGLLPLDLTIPWKVTENWTGRGDSWIPPRVPPSRVAVSSVNYGFQVVPLLVVLLFRG